MNELYIVTTYVIVDNLCHHFLGESKYNPKMTPAEIVLVAIVAAKYFQNHLERALLVMGQLGYIPPHRQLSVSRFNRQLHKHLDTVEMCVQILVALSQEKELFILDSIPAPVCKRARARRCRKVQGLDFCGYCAAKKEKFFGWRLHLICDPDGLPVRFIMLPGGFHDLTPIYELSYELPDGSKLLGDKAYNDKDAEALLSQAGVRLVPIRKKNMKKQHTWEDDYDLRHYRKTIETVNSQLESMGINRLRARTNNGFYIKIMSALIALWFTQAIAN
jgi:hypothetical protein